MTKIIPIKDLRNTTKISSLCNESSEPIFVSKNGYEDLVIMSSKYFDNLTFSEKKLQNSTILSKNNLFENQLSIYGLIRCAATTIKIDVANVDHNLSEIIKQIDIALNNKVNILLFHELCITGYTCSDLFFNENLLNASDKAILKLKECSIDKEILFCVGAPIRYESKIYNCAVLISKGQLLGIVPKTILPNYNEFYEKRFFNEWHDENNLINFYGNEVPFGNKLIFVNSIYNKLKIGVELCEDLWGSDNSDISLCKNGANIILNLSASNEIIKKDDVRRTLIKATSYRLICGYIYASCGDGESTTDLVFSGHNIIAENGEILTETKLFENKMIISEIDVEALESLRQENTSFRRRNDNKFDYVFFNLNIENQDELFLKIDRHPFISSNNLERINKSNEIILMQAKGLIKRMEITHSKKVVIGLSGGLDSTIALIATVEAFKIMGKNLKDIEVITLPAFGTSSLTYNNAIKLANEFGTSIKEINIKNSLISHFKDINHDINNHNVTYENAQARERTQILLDYSNDINAIMIGTGDLSELCLGFTTYAGDHISSYGLNSSLPKTLIQAVVKDYADQHEEIKDTLYSILNTPISPELLPPNENDNISQKTEEKLGVYELHDFFIYYFLKYNFSISKIYYLAKLAFNNSYDKNYIKNTLEIFIKRFFISQFKRSCLPDGIKITDVAISPRGDWRMPSDANYTLYLNELSKLD